VIASITIVGQIYFTVVLFHMSSRQQVLIPFFQVQKMSDPATLEIAKYMLYQYTFENALQITSVSLYDIGWKQCDIERAVV